MDRRLLVALSAAMLLTAQVALSQTVVTVQPPLGLGYGPQSVIPLTSGTPIFTQGDELWAQSYAASATMTLILVSPTGSLAPTVNLPPEGLVHVYTFGLSDLAGAWTIIVYTGQVVTQVKISVVNVTYGMVPAVVNTGLTNGSLALQYSLPVTPAYGIQACLLGAKGGPTSAFSLPTPVGGELKVSLNDSAVSALAPSATAPIPAWFELYTPRTYTNGTALVSSEILAAQTQVFNLGVSPSQVSARLNSVLGLRDGRYDLRAFVRAPSGLVSYDAPYLRVNGSSWLSLDGCSDLEGVTTSTFDLRSNLNGSVASWPQQLLMMYDVQGIESFHFSTVPTTEARIDLGNSSHPFPFTRVEASLSGAGTAAWEYYNGSIYLLANAYPLTLEVNLSFENVTTLSLPVVVPSALWAGSVGVPFGSVNVTAIADGAAIANATIQVAPTGEPAAAVKADKLGSALVALPPGEYNFTVTQGGTSASELVLVSAGSSADLQVVVRAGQVSSLVYILAVILAAGVALNVVIWRAYVRRRAAFR